MTTTSLEQIEKKIDNIEQYMISSNKQLDIHPFLFIFLLILFFITMDFWADTTHKFIQAVHPRGDLNHFEYLLVSSILLIILVWATNYSGITITMLGG